MYTYIFISFLISSVASMLMLPYVLHLCHKNGLYDTPNERKVHQSRIPRMGGIVFAPTVALGLAISLELMIGGSEFTDTIKSSTLLIAAGLLVICFTGALDDLFGLSANLKFAMQFFAALAFPICGIYFNNLYGLFGVYELNQWAGYILTVILVMFVVNSTNTIDGIDGLCAGLTIIALAVYNWFFYNIHNYIFCLLIAALVGTLVVFLYYNILGKADKGTKTFMGDSGSLMLGFVLSYLGIKLSQIAPFSTPIHTPREGILVPFSVLLIPTFDLTRVAVGRMLHHRHPFSPDKTHIHHLLMQSGLGQRQTLATLLTADSLLVAFNLVGFNFGVNINIIVLADIIIYGAAVAMLFKYINRKGTASVSSESVIGKGTGAEIQQQHQSYANVKRNIHHDFSDTDVTISIIVATYNSAETLADTLESILSQTYQKYEVILCDGMSKDGTMDIVKSYESKFNGKLKAVSEPDKGIYDAMNKGIDRATGDVVGILNSDDFYTNDYVLERIADAYRRTPLLEAVYGDVHYVKPTNLDRTVRYYSSSWFRARNMRMGFMPAHPSFYCLRDLYTTYGKYRLEYKVAADFDQLLRLLYVHRVRALYIDMDFVTMRTGGASNSGLKSHLQIMRDHTRSMKSYGIRVFYTLLAVRYIYKSFEVAYGRLRYR